jgi:molybdopterin-binding protein
MQISAQSAEGHREARHARRGHERVVVDVGGQEVVALITKASVDRLALKPGDAVLAIIKSTDVMIGK